MGYEIELDHAFYVAALGGVLGVLMMIPLRHGLIVQEHGTLTYPEGTACADVLIVGEQGGTNARTVVIGFLAGGLYKLAYYAFKLWREVIGTGLSWVDQATGEGEGLRRRLDRRRGQPRAARRRLHHRPAGGGDHLRRRRALRTWC